MVVSSVVEEVKEGVPQSADIGCSGQAGAAGAAERAGGAERARARASAAHVRRTRWAACMCASARCSGDAGTPPSHTLALEHPISPAAPPPLTAPTLPAYLANTIAVRTLL